MDFEEDFELEHLLFTQRKCTSCGEVKSLMDDFYLTRKNRGTLPSAYSYECKECTIRRVSNARKAANTYWEYPDW